LEGSENVLMMMMKSNGKLVGKSVMVVMMVIGKE
jgi:hypothetical protein